MGLRELNRVQATGGSTLLLISDGHANAGEKDPQFFTDVSTKSAADKVTTSTIGLGTGYDETILEALAQGGGGAHRFAGTIDEAVGAIAAEVDDLLDKTIVNAVLRLTPTSAMTSAPACAISFNQIAPPLVNIMIGIFLPSCSRGNKEITFCIDAKDIF